MAFIQKLHIFLCLVASLGLTAGAYLWSDRVYRGAEVATGLAWARQVTSQLDTLALQAREKGQSDPLGWAVSLLTQGPEPRVMRLFKLESGASMQSEENFAFDRTTGVFDYSKILQPEKGRGVRIQVQLGYMGFLGARSRASSDILLLGFFSLVYLTFFFFSVWIFGLAGERRLKTILSRWVAEAKLLLTQFGTQIRELLRGEQMLMKSATECNELLASLEARIQGQLKDLEVARRNHANHVQLLKRTETLALSAAIEASRLGPGGKRVAELSEELHRIAGMKQELARENGAALDQTMRDLEAWTEDVRSASRMAVTIFGASQTLNSSLQSATSVVMDQAKLMRELNLQLSREIPVKMKTDLSRKSSKDDEGGQGTPAPG
jgi:hypothetical protein